MCVVQYYHSTQVLVGLYAFSGNVCNILCTVLITRDLCCLYTVLFVYCICGLSYRLSLIHSKFQTILTSDIAKNHTKVNIM